jgi:hypothetical protein
VEDVRPVHLRRPTRTWQRQPAGNRGFVPLVGLLLATTALASPLQGAPLDRIDVDTRGDLLVLSWSDTEERLRGSLRPVPPREGQPLQVQLDVSSFEGTAFTGPLILTLREAGATHGQSLTVPQRDHHWQATFTPESDGPYLLDVSFKTTHHKSLHAAFEVAPSRVPRLVGWGVLGLGCLALLGFALRDLLRPPRPREPEPSAPAAPPAPEAGTSPTTEPPEAGPPAVAPPGSPSAPGGAGVIPESGPSAEESSPPAAVRPDRDPP